MTAQNTVHSLEADTTEAQLKDQRRQLQSNPADRVLELTIAAAEKRVRILRRDHAALITRVESREAADRQREQDARAELETTLMNEYMQASLGTTDAEAKAALPELMHQHRMRQIGKQDELVAAALSRYRI